MNTETMKGQMKKNAGRAKQNIGQNRDDTDMHLEGKREEFIGMAQEKYGIAKDKARAMIDDWTTRAYRSSEEMERKLEDYDRQLGEVASNKLPDSVNRTIDRYPWLTLVMMMAIGMVMGRILSPSR